MVVETIKTWGKERIDGCIVVTLSNRLLEEKKKNVLEETTDVSEWIYAVIRKVCVE